MAATLTDVAARAEVSVATASRAFKDPSRLSSETLQRVLAAGTEIGYRGRIPSVGRTYGVVVPDISNSALSGLVKAVQNQAWHGRHQMILADTNEDIAREQEILEAMSQEVDGILLCSPRLSSSRILQATGSLPLVIINGEAECAASVLMDVNEGLAQAIEHLQALGHRKVVYVPGPVSSWANARRHSAVARFCLERDVELMVVGNQAATVLGGVAAAAAVVSSGATAVIAYNDLVALGVQSGARNLGKRCPEDISVVGIDDLDIAAVAQPSLTSVRVDMERSGSLGFEMLLDQIAGQPREMGEVHIQSQLVVRNSTARVSLAMD